jgi:hypothetical protein
MAKAQKLGTGGIVAIVLASLAALTGGALTIRHFIKKGKEDDTPKLPTDTTPPAAPNPNPPNDGKDHLISPKPAGVPTAEALKDPKNIKAALESVAQVYGKDIAKNVEKIYLNETRFRSGQYVNSGSAGMATWSETFPYSWSSLADFWKKYPQFAPVGQITYKIGRENGKEWSYLAFPQVGGFFTLAEILRMRGNDVGRYASTDANSATAQSYRDQLAKIKLIYMV